MSGFRRSQVELIHDVAPNVHQVTKQNQPLISCHRPTNQQQPRPLRTQKNFLHTPESVCAKNKILDPDGVFTVNTGVER